MAGRRFKLPKALRWARGSVPTQRVIRWCDFYLLPVDDEETRSMLGGFMAIASVLIMVWFYIQVVDPVKGVQTPMQCLYRHGCVAVDLQGGVPVNARQMDRDETVLTTLRFFKSAGDGLVVLPRRLMQKKQLCDAGSEPLFYWQDRFAPQCTPGCFEYCAPEPLTERRQPVVSLSGVTIYEGERPEIALFDTKLISGRVDRSAVVTRNMEPLKTEGLVTALNVTGVETKTLSINVTFPAAYPTWRPNNPFNVYAVDVNHKASLWYSQFVPPLRRPNVTCTGPVFSPTFPDSSVQASKCPTDHPAAQVGAYGTADFTQITTPTSTASGTSPKIPYGTFTDTDLVFLHDTENGKFDLTETYDESNVRFVVIGGATSLVTEEESLKMSWMDVFLELGALWGIVELVCGFLVKEFEGWMRDEINATRSQLKTARLLQKAAYANEVVGSERTSVNSDLDEDDDLEAGDGDRGGGVNPALESGALPSDREAAPPPKSDMASVVAALRKSAAEAQAPRSDGAASGDESAPASASELRRGFGEGLETAPTEQIVREEVRDAFEPDRPLPSFVSSRAGHSGGRFHVQGAAASLTAARGSRPTLSRQGTLSNRRLLQATSFRQQRYDTFLQRAHTQAAGVLNQVVPETWQPTSLRSGPASQREGGGKSLEVPPPPADKQLRKMWSERVRFNVAAEIEQVAASGAARASYAEVAPVEHVVASADAVRRESMPGLGLPPSAWAKVRDVLGERTAKKVKLGEILAENLRRKIVVEETARILIAMVVPALFLLMLLVGTPVLGEIWLRELKSEDGGGGPPVTLTEMLATSSKINVTLDIDWMTYTEPRGPSATALWASQSKPAALAAPATSTTTSVDPTWTPVAVKKRPDGSQVGAYTDTSGALHLAVLPAKKLAGRALLVSSAATATPVVGNSTVVSTKVASAVMDIDSTGRVLVGYISDVTGYPGVVLRQVLSTTGTNHTWELLSGLTTPQGATRSDSIALKALSGSTVAFGRCLPTLSALSLHDRGWLLMGGRLPAAASMDILATPSGVPSVILYQSPTTARRKLQGKHLLGELLGDAGAAAAPEAAPGAHSTRTVDYHGWGARWENHIFDLFPEFAWEDAAAQAVVAGPAVRAFSPGGAWAGGSNDAPVYARQTTMQTAAVLDWTGGSFEQLPAASVQCSVSPVTLKDGDGNSVMICPQSPAIKDAQSPISGGFIVLRYSTVDAAWKIDSALTPTELSSAVCNAIAAISVGEGQLVVSCETASTPILLVQTPGGRWQFLYPPAPGIDTVKLFATSFKESGNTVTVTVSYRRKATNAFESTSLSVDVAAQSVQDTAAVGGGAGATAVAGGATASPVTTAPATTPLFSLPRWHEFSDSQDRLRGLTGLHLVAQHGTGAIKAFGLGTDGKAFILLRRDAHSECSPGVDCKADPQTQPPASTPPRNTTVAATTGPTAAGRRLAQGAGTPPQGAGTGPNGKLTFNETEPQDWVNLADVPGFAEASDTLPLFSASRNTTFTIDATAVKAIESAKGMLVAVGTSKGTVTLLEFDRARQGRPSEGSPWSRVWPEPIQFPHRLSHEQLELDVTSGRMSTVFTSREQFVLVDNSQTPFAFDIVDNRAHGGSVFLAITTRSNVCEASCNDPRICEARACLHTYLYRDGVLEFKTPVPYYAPAKNVVQISSVLGETTYELPSSSCEPEYGKPLILHEGGGFGILLNTGVFWQLRDGAWVPREMFPLTCPLPGIAKDPRGATWVSLPNKDVPSLEDKFAGFPPEVLVVLQELQVVNERELAALGLLGDGPDKVVLNRLTAGGEMHEESVVELPLARYGYCLRQSLTFALDGRPGVVCEESQSNSSALYLASGQGGDLNSSTWTRFVAPALGATDLEVDFIVAGENAQKIIMTYAAPRPGSSTEVDLFLKRFDSVTETINPLGPRLGVGGEFQGRKPVQWGSFPLPGTQHNHLRSLMMGATRMAKPGVDRAAFDIDRTVDPGAVWLVHAAEVKTPRGVIVAPIVERKRPRGDWEVVLGPKSYSEEAKTAEAILNDLFKGTLRRLDAFVPLHAQLVNVPPTSRAGRRFVRQYLMVTYLTGRADSDDDDDKNMAQQILSIKLEYPIESDGRVAVAEVEPTLAAGCYDTLRSDTIRGLGTMDADLGWSEVGQRPAYGPNGEVIMNFCHFAPTPKFVYGTRAPSTCALYYAQYLCDTTFYLEGSWVPRYDQSELLNRRVVSKVLTTNLTILGQPGTTPLLDAWAVVTEGVFNLTGGGNNSYYSAKYADFYLNEAVQLEAKANYLAEGLAGFDSFNETFTDAGGRVFDYTYSWPTHKLRLGAPTTSAYVTRANIDVAEHVNISSVDVFLYISHRSPNDLRITLTNNVTNETVACLVEARKRFRSEQEGFFGTRFTSDPNINATLPGAPFMLDIDFSYQALLETLGQCINWFDGSYLCQTAYGDWFFSLGASHYGAFRPMGARCPSGGAGLDAFHGTSSKARWTLSVDDQVEGTDGFLLQWGLRLVGDGKVVYKYASHHDVFGEYTTTTGGDLLPELGRHVSPELCPGPELNRCDQQRAKPLKWQAFTVARPSTESGMDMNAAADTRGRVLAALGEDKYGTWDGSRSSFRGFATQAVLRVGNVTYGIDGSEGSTANLQADTNGDLWDVSEFCGEQSARSDMPQQCTMSIYRATNRTGHASSVGLRYEWELVAKFEHGVPCEPGSEGINPSICKPQLLFGRSPYPVVLCTDPRPAVVFVPYKRGGAGQVAGPGAPVQEGEVQYRHVALQSLPNAELIARENDGERRDFLLSRATGLQGAVDSSAPGVDKLVLLITTHLVADDDFLDGVDAPVAVPSQAFLTLDLPFAPDGTQLGHLPRSRSSLDEPAVALGLPAWSTLRAEETFTSRPDLDPNPEGLSRHLAKAVFLGGSMQRYVVGYRDSDIIPRLKIRAYLGAGQVGTDGPWIKYIDDQDARREKPLAWDAHMTKAPDNAEWVFFPLILEKSASQAAVELHQYRLTGDSDPLGIQPTDYARSARSYRVLTLDTTLFTSDRRKAASNVGVTALVRSNEASTGVLVAYTGPAADQVFPMITRIYMLPNQEQDWYDPGSLGWKAFHARLVNSMESTSAGEEAEGEVPGGGGAPAIDEEACLTQSQCKRANIGQVCEWKLLSNDVSDDITNNARANVALLGPDAKGRIFYVGPQEVRVLSKYTEQGCGFGSPSTKLHWVAVTRVGTRFVRTRQGGEVLLSNPIWSDPNQLHTWYYSQGFIYDGTLHLAVSYRDEKDSFGRPVRTKILRLSSITEGQNADGRQASRDGSSALPRLAFYTSAWEEVGPVDPCDGAFCGAESGVDEVTGQTTNPEDVEYRFSPYTINDGFISGVCCGRAWARDLSSVVWPSQTTATARRRATARRMLAARSRELGIAPGYTKSSFATGPAPPLDAGPLRPKRSKQTLGAVLNSGRRFLGGDVPDDLELFPAVSAAFDAHDLDALGRRWLSANGTNATCVNGTMVNGTCNGTATNATSSLLGRDSSVDPLASSQLVIYVPPVHTALLQGMSMMKTRKFCDRFPTPPANAPEVLAALFEPGFNLRGTYQAPPIDFSQCNACGMQAHMLLVEEYYQQRAGAEEGDYEDALLSNWYLDWLREDKVHKEVVCEDVDLDTRARWQTECDPTQEDCSRASTRASVAVDNAGLPDYGRDCSAGVCTFVADHTLQNVPIADLAVTEDVLPVDDDCRLVKVQVEIDIQHDDVRDLEIELVAPWGTAVMLADGRGMDELEVVPSYDRTVFSDAANRPVRQADFSGNFNLAFRDQFSPVTPLGWFIVPPGTSQNVPDGSRPNARGDWRLRVTDKVGGNAGFIEGWKLDLRCASLGCPGMSANDTCTFERRGLSTPIVESTILNPSYSPDAIYIHNTQCRVSDIEVVVDITHDYMGDLNLWLGFVGEEPGHVPRVARLSKARGGSGNGFFGVVFDDQATNKIADVGDVLDQLTGAFKPEDKLNFFTGEPAQGTWSLIGADFALSDVGEINGWQLRLHCGGPGEPEFDLTGGAAKIAAVAEAFKVIPADIGRGVDLPDATSSGPSEVTLEIDVSEDLFEVEGGACTISELAAIVDISHTYISDLTVFLQTPSGTGIEISTFVGNDGQGFRPVLFTDLADVSIVEAIPTPEGFVAGVYRPYATFSFAKGDSAIGTWTLNIADHYQFDKGKLNRFELFVQCEETPRIFRLPTPPLGATIHSTEMIPPDVESSVANRTFMIPVPRESFGDEECLVLDVGLRLSIDHPEMEALTFALPNATNATAAPPSPTTPPVLISADYLQNATAPGRAVVFRGDGAGYDGMRSVVFYDAASRSIDRPETNERGNFIAGIYVPREKLAETFGGFPGYGQWYLEVSSSSAALGTLKSAELLVRCGQPRVAAALPPGMIISDAAGLPKRIPDLNQADGFVTVEISPSQLDPAWGGSCTIRDVVVDVEIGHTYLSDLVVYLRPPDPPGGPITTAPGSRVTLFEEIGASFNGVANLQLNGSADANVQELADFVPAVIADPSDRTQPLRVRPSSSFGGLWGQSALGTWSVDVYDLYEADFGTMKSFRLYVTCEEGFLAGNGNAVVVRSTDTPHDIADNSMSAPLYLSVEPSKFVDFGGQCIIDKLSISLGITHTYFSDLAVSLVAPWGGRFVLFNGILSNYNGGVRVVFDADGLPIDAIETLSQPAGTFRPSSDLSNAAGRSAVGEWTLEVTDSAEEDVGQVLGFTLLFECSIPDSGSSPVPLNLQVPASEFASQGGGCIIADVDVELNIAHTYFSDLRATLTAPGGGSISLFSGVLGSFAGTVRLVFDDDASTLVSAISTPPDGTYRPMVSLADFVGQSAVGQWTVTVSDTADGDVGNIMRIPDSGSSPAPLNLQVAASEFTSIGGDCTITDLDVGLDIAHTYFSDLQATLTAPGGGSISLFSGVLGSFAGTVRLVFDDDASTLVSAISTPPDGTYRPTGSLADFVGQSAVGQWTMAVTDTASGDVGSIMRIPDSGSSPAPLNLQVAASEFTSIGGDCTITDLDVGLDIAHTYFSDLQATLTAPGGGSISLFSGVLGSFAGTVRLVFDDDASTLVSAISTPPDGTYRPTGSLADFVGQSPPLADVAYAGSLPASIPDNDAAGVTLDITTTTGDFGGSSCKVKDVQLVLALTHTYWNDLGVTLTSPSGNSVAMFRAIPFTGSGTGAMTFNDTSSTEAQTQSSLPSGVLQPRERLRMLDWDNGVGTWSLNVADTGALDTGTIGAFSLRITCQPSSARKGRVPAPSGDLPLSIPDATTGTPLNIVVSGGACTVQSVTVDVRITHTYWADLTLTVTSPEGTTLTMFAGVGDSNSGTSTVVLDMRAATQISGTALPSGYYRPTDDLGDFLGENALGTWQLTASDGASGDLGTIDSAGLTINCQ
ncbi:unnamed protein product [Pedinophyceae sp. YPF-701]|nr:unnamed protein product [Pedinophyceae sp. YPF-701]